MTEDRWLVGVSQQEKNLLYFLREIPDEGDAVLIAMPTTDPYVVPFLCPECKHPFAFIFKQVINND